VSRATIRAWRLGTAVPTGDRLAALAAALGVEVSRVEKAIEADLVDHENELAAALLARFRNEA
jgi:transcriptional regulator with XRE-family HTH domain